uniref:Uncharacterized protein AlNc14C17G1827 n=1 Tax=Albugo laibachii Nc14 TaxID=890382 RepID=F0W4K7_9STRA|nr:hypothetical protein DDB_G0280073 [Albugo laibachii Nc14]|eukprot:CCA16040.1 hypothetical protein DDB_G0280073 [Albugo laibachii Nc14]
MLSIPSVIPSHSPVSLNPPLYYEIVGENVYQSNKFDASSFTFVSNLGLKTIIYLSSDELSIELTDFFKEINVEVIHLGAKYRSTSPWKSMTEGMAKEAIQFVLEKQLHPLMLMCKTGIHMSGTVIGCLRRLQNWSLTAIIDNYRNLASSVKTRFENEQFIELFDIDLVTLPEKMPDWFVESQKIMEEEKLAILKGECYPGETSVDSFAANMPAYKRHYFQNLGPLISSSVVFSEKLSIIGDDDDD